MTLDELVQTKFLLLGYGVTHAALAKELRRRFANLPLAIADENPNLVLPEMHNVTVFKGPDYLAHLEEYEVIIRSPGIPYHPALEGAAERITTSTQLFFDELRVRTPGAACIGITGTKGKSTTAALTHMVLKNADRKSFLIGNIGLPEWETIEKINNESIAVYEFSSYMLHDFHGRPDIAVLLDIFPDHLNWHGSYRAYREAKSHITLYQTEDDMLVYHASYPDVTAVALASHAKKVPVNTSDGVHVEESYFMDGTKPLFPRSSLAIPGMHNAENAAAVIAIAQTIGIGTSAIESAFKAFSGLPHRLEYVGTYGDILFYDDAISTTPESTMAAVRTFGKSLGSLILGGLDRGYDYTPLAQLVAEVKIPVVVLLPGGREKIKNALREARYDGTVKEAADMQEAVRHCFENTPAGRIALLSTAAPSYDLFKNFEDKGDQYKEAIKQFSNSPNATTKE